MPLAGFNFFLWVLSGFPVFSKKLFFVGLKWF